MLFKDRLEIWNPGSLPYGLTTAKLRKPHSSIPANSLLAAPINRIGQRTRISQSDLTQGDAFNSDY
ncbi:ATP-binding protein [Flavobacterium sp. UBA6031]|jgi:predicted HTH transcriptional regulator|uniref:ATP-binding protein n=1 Tax=Flavobacterium sp. UBA6031 TaxID=1946551 RepID=UPI0025C7341C|nr:ATP-binding protein [Flavobacterium sp. UBA6031]